MLKILLILQQLCFLMFYQVWIFTIYLEFFANSCQFKIIFQYNMQKLNFYFFSQLLQLFKNIFIVFRFCSLNEGRFCSLFAWSCDRINWITDGVNNRIEVMSFAKEPKRLNEQTVFNPPPAYYESQLTQGHKPAPSFSKAQRFVQKQYQGIPGPGAYHDNQKQKVKQRIVDESQKRQLRGGEASESGNIKISSIPSIPKKSATRVYQQLAPGILILHEQQYQNTSIGPGSYNISEKLVHPKTIGHKIAPQPKRKQRQQQVSEPNIPTIAEQIRNERRMMYKQNLVKSSTVNKGEISPSDLCLEVIILRQKLLRSDENPPPGYYHNENLSNFRGVEQEQRPAQLQFLGGKEKRFGDGRGLSLGPGQYTIGDERKQNGGFIPKSPRKIHQDKDINIGPGAYISQKLKPKIQNKASYPPIFGSGSTRFSSAPRQINRSTPGPASYQPDKKKNKKQKYIKIKRQFLEPNRNAESMLAEPVLGIQNDISQLSAPSSFKQRHFHQVEKNSSNFASKVTRFGNNAGTNEGVAPGIYQIQRQNFASGSFNRKGEGYLGSRAQRFDQTQIRPKLGPGTYNPAYQTVKQRKIINVCL